MMTENLLQDKYNELNLKSLEDVMGYEFRDKILLVKALAHPSLKQYYHLKQYFIKQKYDFEKLEFLGDSVLSLAVIDLLIKIYPTAPHSNLAKFKNYLVSRKVVSSVASGLKLSEFWFMTEGEKKSGGQNNLSNFENALESLLGALYVDSGDIKICNAIVQKLWLKHIYEVKSIELDPKGSLQELSHVMNLGTPVYELISSNKVNNETVFTVKVALQKHFCEEGKGKSKKEAEVQAAKKLLLLLSANCD